MITLLQIIIIITCPLADSYIIVAARESGAVAEAALDGRYIFESIAIETGRF